MTLSIVKGEKYRYAVPIRKNIAGNEETITFSDGKIIELKNVWGIQGIDKIIDPGIWSRFSNEILIDFRVGWLKLKKLDNDKILIYVKDE